MYAHSHQLQVINGVNVDHASDSGSTNMSISMMTSISEQDESVSLDDDCPDYDAVVNKRQDSSFSFFCKLIFTFSNLSNTAQTHTI